MSERAVPDVPVEVAGHLDELTALIVATSRRSLEWFGAGIAIDNKRERGFDPVTEADRTIETELREALLERFPHHVVVGEEFGRSGGEGVGSDDPLVEWVIDPIDGTGAFVTGRPMWGTLVGLLVDGVPTAGWMHQPVLDLTHVGTPDGTRVVRGGNDGTPAVQQAVGVRTTTDLADAVLLCTHPSMFADDPAGFERLAGSVRQSRFDGDCANYGFVATGHADLVVERSLQLYDIAALVPIVEGAGGIVADRRGAAPGSPGWREAGSWAIAAATRELHAQAVATLG